MKINLWLEEVKVEVFEEDTTQEFISQCGSFWGKMLSQTIYIHL